MAHQLMINELVFNNKYLWQSFQSGNDVGKNNNNNTVGWYFFWRQLLYRLDDTTMQYSLGQWTSYYSTSLVEQLSPNPRRIKCEEQDK